MSLIAQQKTAEDKLQEQYQILNSLGNGSFGYILAIRNKKTGQKFACKIEKHHAKKMILVEKQFHIMFSLMHYGCFPSVLQIQKFKEHSYLIMEKFDHTLHDLFVKNNKKFSLSTIAMITDQCFTTLRLLHEGGYLHRDLKPENFMIKNHSHQIKLIDFGLADGTNAKKSSNLLGNVRFSSRGAHFGLSSQKDDLESLIYVVVHLMIGELPWASSTKTEIELEINRKTDKNMEVDTPILKKKYAFVDNLTFPETKNQIKKVFYEQFRKLVTYVFDLDAQAEPNYNRIEQICRRLLILSGTKRGNCFDWCGPNCPSKQRGELWDVFAVQDKSQEEDS